MNTRVLRLMLATVLGICAAGCQHTCQRTSALPVRPSAGCDTCNAPPIPGTIVPVPATRPPLVQTPAAQLPGDSRSYLLPPASLPPAAWQAPADSRARFGAPSGETVEPPRQGVRLQSPEFVPQAPAKPPVVEDRPPSAPLPVGIPQFVKVKDQVASGLKPLQDGWDWLKDNGYRTLVHLRQPGEDDAPDRLEVEKRGLKYHSLELSPKTLSKTVVEEFTRLVGDKGNYPLFVYDKDGVVAGGLWYLSFRTADRLTDEEARKKAGGLGLKEEQAGDQRLMWLAIQKYLSELNR